MTSLLARITARAAAATVPLSAHLDLTYRCNENCVHCYLGHSRAGEMTLTAIETLLGELAGAGTLFLLVSGGEPLLRPDLFPILERARALLFHVILKTNGTQIGELEARRLAELAIAQVHVSLYSGNPALHDSITRLPGSFQRSVDALRLLSRHGVRTRIVTPLMARTAGGHPGLQRLAASVGADLRIDPTLTPALNGDETPVSLRAPIEALQRLFRDPSVVINPDEFCAPPPAAGPDVLDDYPCSAAHNFCYISPSGDVMPCVQFPVVSGNVRKRHFADIWRNSKALVRIRAIRVKDLPLCRACSNVSVCGRCPGLAYMAGDFRGPSLLDCEKSFARTGLVPPPAVPFLRCSPAS